ncbi:DUF748 domain-containing protein [Amantichitinum ursilacus]|uniref:AsmA family protein n=1 Tax=Amantichitinum ursilacus TaxID=857265 RepID=A0A0N0XIP3_9NEIS|nr:DUF748 domain-containing protein [Amantichitinum ursilacus]KPC50844.1 AsmA family protein [Amantichitinum ursilacus]
MALTLRKPFSALAATRWRRLLVIAASVLVLLLLLGGLALPWLARPRLEAALTQALHRPSTIADLSFNPFLLRATVTGLAVQQQGQPAFSVARLTANLQLSSIWQRGPVLSELTIEQPRLRLVRTGPQQYNWSDLLQPSPEHKQTDGGLPRFAVYNIRIKSGQIDFEDTVTQRRNKIDQIEIGVPFISSLPVFVQAQVEPHLAFALDGAKFDISGKTTPFQATRQSTLDLRANDIDIPRYLAYLPAQAGWRLPAARLDSNLQLVFREENHAPQLRLSGNLVLRDAQLQQGSGAPLASVKRLQVDLADVRPLDAVYQLARVQSEGLHVAVTRPGQGGLNWQQAFAAPTRPSTQPVAQAASDTASAAAAHAGTAGKPTLFNIAQLQLNHSTLDWRDDSVSPAVQARFDPLSLTAQQVGNLPGKPAQLELQTTDDRGMTLKQSATLLLQPLHITGHTQLSGMVLPAIQPYLAPWLNLTVQQGTLGVQGDLDYQAGKLPRLSHVQLDIARLKAQLDEHKTGTLQFEALQIAAPELDLAAARYQIEHVQWRNGSLTAARLKDGNIDWGSLLRKPAAVDSARPVAEGVRQVQQAPQPAAQVSVGKVAVEGMALRYADESLRRLKPLEISQIKLDAGPLQWPSATPMPLHLSAQGSRNGAYDVAGTLSNAPWAGKLKLDVRNADIGYGQAYFTRWLNITLATARLSAKGDLAFNAGNKPSGSYRGNLSVNDLYALDKVTGDDFLKFKRLQINGIAAQSQPLKVDVNDILLQNFYSRLVLYADGTLNLANVVVKEGNVPHAGQLSLTASAPAAVPTPTPAVAPKAQAASAPVNTRPRAPLPPVRIKRITLAGGNINYTDNFIQPNYTVNLTDMAGTVTGLSSAPGTRAALDLHGSADRMAPVAVSGQLNPLADPLFLDINASIKGYNLAAASTYSAKYAGYGITKGKLSMQLHYLVDQRKLQAQNKLTLDQLTLGDQVDSPSATKLPVKLALSLLTDRHGQINLDLPVTGSLDDPQFSVGGLIFKVIVNLLEKAITAPFDLLTSAFGGGSHASFTTFAAGSAHLDAAALDDLHKLTQALNDRPAIKLEISGWADPSLDAAGIKQAALESRLRAAKAAAMTAQGDLAADQDSLEITPAERPALLTRVYKQAKFAKPTNLIGLNKSLPPEEMEKLLLANLPAGADEMRGLANARAQAVKAELEKEGVAAERIYLTQPRIDGGGDVAAKDKGPATRAMFKLG